MMINPLPSSAIVKALRRSSVGAAMLSILMVPGVASAQSSADMDALVKAARQEGSLMLYSGFTEKDNLKAAELFKDKYGINVDIFRGNTNDVLARYDLELQADRVNVDVLALADAFASTKLKGRGALLQYSPPSTKESGFDKRFAGSHYQIVGLTIWPAAWNTDKVPAAKVPHDFADYLDPFWKGRLGMLDASASLVGLQYYYLVRRAMGVDFMKKLGAQGFQFVSPNNAIAERIVVGEVYGAPLLILNVADQFIGKGAPLKVGYMASGTPVLQRTIQVAAKAKHPNAAKLFVNFILSKEGQEGFQGVARAVSPRTDVSIEGVPSLASTKTLTIEDVEAFVGSQKELQEEFRQFFKTN